MHARQALLAETPVRALKGMGGKLGDQVTAALPQVTTDPNPNPNFNPNQPLPCNPIPTGPAALPQVTNVADLARVDQAELSRSKPEAGPSPNLHSNPSPNPSPIPTPSQAELSRRFGEPTARWLHAAGTGTLEEEVRVRVGVRVRVRVRLHLLLC